MMSVVRRALVTAPPLCLSLALLAGWGLAGQGASGQGAGNKSRRDQARTGASGPLEFERLLEEYQQLTGQGRYGEALPLGERLLVMLEEGLGPNHLDLATSLNSVAEIHYLAGDYERAESLFLRALSIREKALGPDHPDVAISVDNLAAVYQAKGDYARAEPLNRRALAILEKALGPDHPDVATSANNIAALYKAKGDHAGAELLLRRALTINEKAFGPEHPAIVPSLGNLASLYQAKGDYTGAEPLYQRALSIGERSFGPNHPDVASLLNSLALLYYETGDYEKAESLNRRALSIREKALGPDNPDVAASLNNLALLYKTKGDYAKAEPLYQRALAAKEKVFDPEHPAVATALNNLAAMYAAKGDYARAEPLFRRSLAVREKALGAEHSDVANSLDNLAALYQAKGDYARAEPLRRRALDIFEKVLSPYHPTVATSLENLAALYQARGDTARAMQLFSRAEEVSERNLSLFLGSASERRNMLYLDTLSGQTYALVSLHARSADPQAARLALTAILRRKGRAIDAIADQVASLRRRLDPQDRALLDQLSAAQSRLSALVLGGPGKTPPGAHKALISRLESEVERLRDAVSRRSAELRAQTLSATIEQVRQALPADSALVEFFSYRPYDANAKPPAEQFGAWRYIVYVLRKEGEPQWADLGGADEIDSLVSRLRAALREPTRKDVKELARSLDERVMRPARKILGDTRRVFLAPDGALNVIPFAALVDESGKYLVETYTLTYLTSGRDLLRLRLSIESGQPPVVLADPLFSMQKQVGSRPAGGGGGGAPGSRSTDFGALRFNPLPGTAGEAEALGAVLPGARVLTQAQATESALKQVRGPRVLHVATHGFFLPDGPRSASDGSRGLKLTGGEGARPSVRIENYLLRSGLALAGANNLKGEGGEDGILTALEAAGLDLWGTHLVVLSACETGVGAVLSGGGVYGLRRALVLAGSESQVISLWQVSDAATRDLMVSYYKRLRAGEGRTEALRRVQIEMLGGGAREEGGGRRGFDRESGAKEDRSHPFFWAAFIQSGDWREMSAPPASAR